MQANAIFDETNIRNTFSLSLIIDKYENKVIIDWCYLFTYCHELWVLFDQSQFHIYIYLISIRNFRYANFSLTINYYWNCTVVHYNYIEIIHLLKEWNRSFFSFIFICSLWIFLILFHSWNILNFLSSLKLLERFRNLELLLEYLWKFKKLSTMEILKLELRNSLVYVVVVVVFFCLTNKPKKKEKIRHFWTKKKRLHKFWNC